MITLIMQIREAQKVSKEFFSCLNDHINRYFFSKMCNTFNCKGIAHSKHIPAYE